MAPKNGSMFGNQTTFPNEVSFRCDEGFIMTGPGKRRCQKDGTWSGNATLCAGIEVCFCGDCRGLLDIPSSGIYSGRKQLDKLSLVLLCSRIKYS